VRISASKQVLLQQNRSCCFKTWFFVKLTKISNFQLSIQICIRAKLENILSDRVLLNRLSTSVFFRNSEIDWTKTLRKRQKSPKMLLQKYKKRWDVEFAKWSRTWWSKQAAAIGIILCVFEIFKWSHTFSFSPFRRDFDSVNEKNIWAIIWS
jgi:hypothetical protein